MEGNLLDFPVHLHNVSTNCIHIQDILEVEAVLPKSGEKEKLVFAKILKFPTDDRHKAQRRKFILKKPQKNQSSFVKSVGSVDVDYPSHSARHAPKRVVERREPQYFDDAPAPAPVAEPARNIYESDDSDREEEGGHGYGDVHVEATTTSNNTTTTDNNITTSDNIATKTTYTYTNTNIKRSRPCRGSRGYSRHAELRQPSDLLPPL